MVTFEDLMAKQAEIAAIAQMMNGQTDAGKIQQLSASIQRESENLKKLAGTFEQEQQAKYGIMPSAGQPPTPEQQKAEAQTRIVAEQLLSQISSVSPAAAEAVAKLRSDPTFMGGILLKK
jgi:hypothetical protein